MMQHIPRSTLWSMLFLIGSFFSYIYTKPTPTIDMETDKNWLRFEKTQLQSVSIQRPDGSLLILQRQNDHWTTQMSPKSEKKRASKTMINRIKHQLHNLDFRETFTPTEGKQPEDYGLGSKATKVTLHLMGNKEHVLYVGDLNPSKVSYYVQYENNDGSQLYTVKKSSMDMFLQSNDAFRESRIVHMDMKSLSKMSYQGKSHNTTIQLIKKNEKDWYIQQTSEDMVLANREHVMRMIGRLAALKAVSFVDIDQKDLASYELLEPHMTWVLENNIGQRVELQMGKEYDDKMVFYRIFDENTLYVAKKEIIHDFSFSIADIWEQKIFFQRLQDTSKIVLLRDGMAHQMILQGGEWYWSDGSLISGITPQRFFEAIRDAQCEMALESTTENIKHIDVNQIYAQIQIFDVQGNVPLTLDVFARDNDIFLQDGELLCPVLESRIKRIMEDVARESQIHHNP